MSHNLVVSNSKTSDYVQFEVNIPDGYNKFRIDYLNGSLINQNYLKTGDTITFRFANNPIRYHHPFKVSLLYPNEAEFIEDRNTDVHDDFNNDYDFLDLDIIKYYKLVYIPIYQFYDDILGIVNVFNPCKASELLDKPDITVVKSKIMFMEDDNLTTHYADFTGEFVLGLVAVDGNNIPELNITIGESISNSKVRPLDVESFQISNNVVTEVPVNTVTTRTYNYGSVWNYPVNNLIMNHVETKLITYDDSVDYNTDEIELTLAQKVPEVYYDCEEIEGDDLYCTTSDVITNLRCNNEGKGYSGRNTYLAGEWNSTLENWSSLSTMLETNYDQELRNRQLLIVTSDDGGSTLNTIVNNGRYKPWSCRGNQLVDRKIYEYDLQTSTATLIDNTDPTKGYEYILEDVYYTSDDIDFQIYEIVSGTAKQVTKTTFHFPSPVTKYECKNTVTYTISGTYIDESEQEVTRNFDIQFRAYDNNSKTFLQYSQVELYLIGDIHVRYHVCVCNYLNTGLYPKQTYLKSNLNPPELFQLTDNSYDINSVTPEEIDTLVKQNSEDLLIEAVSDKEGVGLKISTNTLRNIIHRYIVSKDNLENYNYQVENVIQRWTVSDDPLINTNSDDLDMLAFIPLKTNHYLRRYLPQDLNDPEYVYVGKGYFMINTIDDGVAHNLNVDNINVFLATGHDTLNVEPPDVDDEKFKTFNGTLVFDRSNSRVTRIFSNDLTGACTGYLNDILSAKLSRYFYVCNYNIWNLFFNTNDTMNVSKNLYSFVDVYSNYDLYSGTHNILLTSCCDIVKLIGSENVVNNCMCSLYPEEQQITTTELSLDDFYIPGDLSIDNPELFYYKFFHYYNSGWDDYPYVGHGIHDKADNSGTCGGLNVLKLNEFIYIDYESNFGSLYQGRDNTCTEPLFIMDKKTANDNKSNVWDERKFKYYNTNKYLYTNGFIETLPTFRIYRNANFEQNDLTITTGGIKLLHPIYIQSTPKPLIQNILYLFDYVINYMDKTFNNTTFSKFYVNMMETNKATTPEEYSLLHPSHFGHRYPLYRLYKDLDVGNNKIATSFDSHFILNYIHPRNLNIYSNNKNLVDSLPTKDNIHNEEFIQNIFTNSVETNVQLFSSKYFNFYDHVSELSMVVFDSKYVESVYYNNDILADYYYLPLNTNYQEAVTKAGEIGSVIDSYIGNVLSYNNIKMCNVFISKLGEFLDFPRIMYGGCESFNNSVNVSVLNYDMNKYEPPIITVPNYEEEDGEEVFKGFKQVTNYKPQQRVNTYLYGVMFRYHQLAHGYQNFPNELTNEYVISKSLGNRTFTFTLYDEFGRRFPNRDTSQGFLNNMYLEVYLE